MNRLRKTSTNSLAVLAEGSVLLAMAVGVVAVLTWGE